MNLFAIESGDFDPGPVLCTTLWAEKDNERESRALRAPVGCEVHSVRIFVVCAAWWLGFVCS